MGRELTIREARPSDAAAIREVARAAWHAAYDDPLGSETVDSVVGRAYATDGLRENATDPEDVFLVATAEGELVGFAHARPDEEARVAASPPRTGGGQAEPGHPLAELARIYVVPGRWNRGIGGALLARVEYLLENRGFEQLRLEVLADNGVGVSFYESAGFERVAESEVELDGDSYTEYVYEKGL